MSKYDPTYFHPEDKLAVLLRQNGVDLSNYGTYGRKDAVWFTVKYVEPMGDSFEFLSASRSEDDCHGSLVINLKKKAFTYHLSKDDLKKYPDAATSYLFLEIVPVEWTTHWKNNQHLRIEAPSWEDDPEVFLHRVKNRLAPNRSY